MVSLTSEYTRAVFVSPWMPTSLNEEIFDTYMVWMCQQGYCCFFLVSPCECGIFGPFLSLWGFDLCMLRLLLGVCSRFFSEILQTFDSYLRIHGVCVCVTACARIRERERERERESHVFSCGWICVHLYVKVTRDLVPKTCHGYDHADHHGYYWS